MLATTAVFLTQLLCLLVPCDPSYKLPDTKPLENEKSEIRTSAGVKVHLKDKLGLGLDTETELEIEHELHSNFKYAREVKYLHNSLDFEDCPDEHPYVQTKCGIVQGYRMEVVGGKKICAFEGIPYGEPPVGYLRFRSPVPKKAWKGIMKATEASPECMQYNPARGFRTFGQEDCLILNIYTSLGSKVKHELLPVIVFIHGGGYFFGTAGTYGPTYIAGPVVLVIVQYRIGVLGYLSTGDSVCPGNFGLKDQTLALKWVHENIHNFGGDKHRVTLMGQSAGSASVHMHLLSQSSRAYFRNAVSLSGTAFNYWSFYNQTGARNLTNLFAERVGCPIENSTALVNCMREKNPVKLVAQTPNFLDDWPYPSNAFRPSIEVTEGNPDPFLVDYPENIYRRNEVAKVPWIVTTVSGEGYAFLLYPFLTQQIPQLQRRWDEFAPDLVDTENLNVDQTKLIKRLNRFYFKYVPPDKATVQTFAQIVTDRMFHMGIYEAAKAHVQIASTYSYLFDFNSAKYNAIVNYGYPASEWGVAHSEDLFYFLNASRIYGGFQRQDLEYDISRILTNLITNFAAKNVPVYTTETGKDLLVWLPHDSPENLNFLGVSKNIGMIGDPFRKKMKFWRRLGLPDSPQNVIVGQYPQTFF